jgi:hypothetical protein
MMCDERAFPEFSEPLTRARLTLTWQEFPKGVDGPAGAWRPGMPIRTEQDKANWHNWRRERILTAQRDRRARMRRIDYYASPEADAIINRLRRHAEGGDASSIINMIILEWAAGCGFPE